MYVIRHEDISQQQESARLPGLIKGLARDAFDVVGAKYRETVICYCGDVEAGCVSRDPKSLGFHLTMRGRSPVFKTQCGKSETFRTSGGGAAEGAR